MAIQITYISILLHDNSLKTYLQRLNNQNVWYIITVENCFEKMNHTSIAAGGGGRSLKRKNMCLKNRLWQVWFTKHFFWWRKQSWHFLALSQRATPPDKKIFDDLCLVVKGQSATQCDSSFAQTLPSTTPYYRVLKKSNPRTILCYTILESTTKI